MPVIYCDRCQRTLTEVDTYFTFWGKVVVHTPKGLDTTYYVKSKYPKENQLLPKQYYLFRQDNTKRTDICGTCFTELINFCTKGQTDDSL